MTSSPKSGWPVTGQSVVNSGQRSVTIVSSPGWRFEKLSRSDGS